MPLFPQSDTTENRTLAQPPSLITREGQLNANFFAEVDDYFSEHFVLRSTAVTALSVLKANLFGTSNESQVILGTDGWLYFERTLDDFMGRNVLSDDDMARIATTLDLINEYAASQDAQFLFFVAPNKNTIYPEHMPYPYLPRTGPSNLEKLNAALEDRAYYLNLLPLLQNDSRQLYHKRDSHWNNLGAVVCFEAIMERLQRDHVDYASLPYTLQPIWEGDLDGMLFPTLGYLDEQAVFEYTANYTYTSRFRSEEDITIETAQSQKDGTLLMFRDSFGNALLPLLAEEFGTAEFSRITPYRLNLAEANDSSVILIELVERNLPDLLKAAPVMPAPLRQPQDVVPANATIRGTQAAQGMLQVYGTIEGVTPQDSIYLRVEDAAGIAYYQAFPIYESELLDGEDAVKSGGFSAYLPYASADDITIQVFQTH